MPQKVFDKSLKNNELGLKFLILKYYIVTNYYLEILFKINNRGYL